MCKTATNIKTVISTTEAEYIMLYQAMEDIVPFVSLMKEIGFVLERQRNTPKVMFIFF